MGRDRLHKRALKNGYSAYQLNKVKVVHEKGKAVQVKNSEEEEKLKNLYNWHFIWSKFYYFRKHYGFLLSLFIYTNNYENFLQNFLLQNYKNKKIIKYHYRWNGLKNSILNNKSSMRLEGIKLNIN